MFLNITMVFLSKVIFVLVGVDTWLGFIEVNTLTNEFFSLIANVDDEVTCVAHWNLNQSVPEDTILKEGSTLLGDMLFEHFVQKVRAMFTIALQN